MDSLDNICKGIAVVYLSNLIVQEICELRDMGEYIDVEDYVQEWLENNITDNDTEFNYYVIQNVEKILNNMEQEQPNVRGAYTIISYSEVYG